MENTNNVVFMLILVTLATIHSAIGNTEVGCKETERKALLKFKQDLKDPMNRLSNWVGGGDCCSWTGVACDNLTGHVRELHLGNPYYDYKTYGEFEVYLKYMLGGKINPSLLNLKSLKYLDLSGNDFGRISVPSFIGSLKSLTHLDLSEAEFGGLIPHQLGNLSSLRYLNLKYSGALKVEKLQWISGLTLLQYLDMCGVNMRKAYDSVQVLNTLPSLVELHLCECHPGNLSPDLPVINFTSLSIFDVSANDLFSLPNWLFSLKNLHSLDLSQNLLGVSFQLGLTNMTNRLKILYLSHNCLNSAIPQWLGGLNRLEFLDLSVNELHGNIPASIIGNLTSTVSLDLSGNELDGEIPQSIGNLFRLRELQLSDNKLSGSIPTAIGKLSKLRDFDVFDNQLSGSLPMDIGKLSKLRHFDVSDNQLSGSLPMDIGKLSKLRDFDVSNNQLNGSLPESFGQLVNLKSLYIYNNSLKGMVHEVHFANLSRLKDLDASGNSLNLETSPNWVPPFQLEILNLNSWHLGPKLPLWLRLQQHLSQLKISNAGISATIPIWFCNISSQLISLDISHNQFRGPFPCHFRGSVIVISFNQFIGSLPLVSSEKFEFVDFSNNSFSGSVTHFFCANNSYSGNYISLGNNLLSGAIPNCWEKWKALWFLNLENNNFVGVIPNSMGNLPLCILNLRNNRLSGQLPLSLRDFTDLSILDLGGNKLIGKIPQWIGMSLSSLVVLNLRSNNFQGDIPLQLCNLARLRVLDLAHNNLSGTIPTCFYNLTAMTTLENSSFRSLFYSWGTNDITVTAEAEVVTKGIEVEYSTVLGYVGSIDLSGNNLYGEIPVELTRLHLQTLNLSRNHLVGKIPSKIGNMRWLESLDLSQNQLSGEIPPSISSLSFLSYLNLSCNNLTGHIPTCTQLQSFNESSFIGNQLCGPPLQHNCSANHQSIPSAGVKQGEQDHLLSESNLYLSLGLGFAFGFWAIFGSLLSNMPWSIAFSRVVDRIVLRLYAFVVEIF